ncbi:MAG: YkgJ family cysteine cluster protein [Algoriphagus sp.]|jgi:Fe-S-cluster containining protein|uniref:YkgJ family cysteine cluster protein n=1 Tax=Algoriphagus sp. TaxID=1872435 RepID=UPI002726C510|nr:YkgJ family cysteine cluster protein [Algoriphagus sp.]MDO8965665.1 YkgJ family cysteine cluster protein [Algoriphagus sp.]MDP2042685.1 YkgJ family cysteine cluster protein [Algoriphagus sp.]MDP3200498.1 YkgJ family cysteine cluster protein [Algoriphagus sp.]MDP3470311.1 YkgJ family cysteine cluster protein [Algoriphagus sp.]
MNLFEKSEAVRELFQVLEDESRQFHAESGMGCVSGCGFCCANPEIPASPLEFLPLAFDLYEKGIAEEIANQLALQDQLGNCIVYRSQKDDPTKGYCGNYSNRGLICRLFGASARKTKYGQKDLITCKILKAEKQEAFSLTSSRINLNLEIPIAAAYYTRLADVDQSLANQYPVNQAILMALELVLRFKFYEEAE